MKIRPLLQAVNFGEDVAEHDEGLARYFIQTSGFLDVINDRVDLILGEKGSGKTAILTYLAEPKMSLVELSDTEVIRAFNPQGDIIFRQLCRHKKLSEQTLRLVWTAYIVALLGNHLLANFSNETNLRPLRKALKAADLLSPANKAAGIWALISKLLVQLEIEGEVSVDVPKLPIKSTGRFRWPRRRLENETIDLEEVLHLEHELLSLLGRRAWLLFDRLDEAFASNRRLERLALRALLRTILDIGGKDPTLRIKCCLRTDVLNRVTENQGFVNATHLRRHQLSWDREGIIHLAAQRIAADRDIARQFRIDPAQLQTRRGRLRVCHLVLPERINDHDLFGWVEQRTSDARRRANPRNVISLLGLARKNQLATYDRDDPDYVADQALIAEGAMQQAAAELSSQRLEDTVLAEFSHLRPAIDAMRNKPARMSRDELATALSMESDGRDFLDLVSDLIYCGIVSTTGNRVLSVALLYRPALQSQAIRSTKGKHLGDEERQTLEKATKDAVAEMMAAGLNSTTIEEFDNRQSNFILQFVRNNFPELTADRRKGAGPFALGRVELRAKRGTNLGKGIVEDTKNGGKQTANLQNVTDIVSKLVTKIEDGATVAISELVDRGVQRAIEHSSQRGADGNIRMIAHLEASDHDGTDRVRVVFARDLPGETLDDNEAALDQPENVSMLQSYVGEVANIVAVRGNPAHLRPLGTLATSEAIAVLRSRRDVTYRIASARGGTAVRLVILRVS